MNWKKMVTMAAAAATVLTLGACSSKTAETNYLKNIQDKGKLVVATSPDYAPFEFQTMVDGKNKIVGSDMTLAQKIADELGVELEISPMSFDNTLAAVKNGKADMAIAGISIDETRKKSFDFSKPYFEVADAVLVRKEDANKYNSTDSLANIDIAVQKSSTQEKYAKQNLTKATLISLTDMGEEVTELKSGKVDAVIMDTSVAEGYVAKNKDLAIASVKLPASEENSKAIALPKNSGELKEKVDEVVKKVKDSGEYEKYLEDASKLAKE